MKYFSLKISVLLLCLFCLPLLAMAQEVPPVEPETPIEEVVVEAPPAPAEVFETVLIRAKEHVVYQGEAVFPNDSTIDIVDTDGVTHAINARSALGFLQKISQDSDSFTLTIQYFSAYNSLYLKCITPNGSSELCNNWQYSINGVTPWSSMDAMILSGGETVGFYFGSPHQVVFAPPSVTGEPFVATAQTYNYFDNTWSALAGVTIGVTVSNAADPYNPTVVATQSVDANGSATFTIADVGEYNIGIAEDYYFPSYSLTVAAPATDKASGGSAGSAPIVQENIPAFNAAVAVQYLIRMQNDDGSFEQKSMYTDWLGIALAAGNADDAQVKLIEYLAAHNAVSSILTDNERRAMALLALKQNPYSFQGENYIAAIVKQYDGNQFGDPSLMNDDVFALLPLSESGYTANDEMISKTIAFIISKQKTDGSWEESVDVTAAAVQALAVFRSVSGVEDALSKASVYLQNAQLSDGGFDSVYSTSWAAQAMQVLGTTWTKNGKGAADYFAAQQASDGGFLPNSETVRNRVWATSYAVPAMLGKSWSAIMQSVDRVIEVESEGQAEQEEVTIETQKEIVAEAKEIQLEAIDPAQEDKKAEQKRVSISESREEAVVGDQPQVLSEDTQISLLGAAAAESKSAIPVPVAVGVGVSSVGILWLVRRFIPFV